MALPSNVELILMKWLGEDVQVNKPQSRVEALLLELMESGTAVTPEEVQHIVDVEIAKVVAEAPEDFDTLMEIADWIEHHEDDAAAMNSAIQANARAITALQTAIANAYTKTESDARYQQKEAGKGLSANDFTTAEKTKLAGVEAEANKTVVDSELDSESTNPVQNAVVTEVVEGIREDMVVTKTVTGNPITIDDASERDAEKVVVNFEPVQEGEGDPSPENVRPITGHTQTVVTNSHGSDSDTYTVEFPQEAGTVYNGESNLTNGTLTKYWDKIVIDENTTITQNGNDILAVSIPQIFKVSQIPISSQFIAISPGKSTGLRANQCRLNSNLTAINFKFAPDKTVEEWKSELAITPVELLLKYAEPQVYNISSQAVKLYDDTNVLSATAGSLNVEYFVSGSIGEQIGILDYRVDQLENNVSHINWQGTQAEYEALTPAQKVYEIYNITEDEDEEEPANTASLQSLNPLSLDRNALSLENDYPEEEVSDYADIDE